MSSPSSTMDGEFVEEKKERKSSAGRKLMRWNPDIDQLVLLCVDYICIKEGIAIPWDKVAKQVSNNLSGEAIKQHLAKVYKFRETHGRQVPDRLDKSARRNVKLATPLKGRGKAGIKDESDYEDATPAKGMNLLYTFPEKKGKAKKEKQKQKEDATTTAMDNAPTTPATGGRGGRCKKAKANKDDDAAFQTPTKPSGKRGRTAKKTAKKNDEADEADDESPTKKQRTTVFSFRPTVAIDYNEHLDELNEEEDQLDARQEADDDGDYEEATPMKVETEGVCAEPPPVMKPLATAGTLAYQGLLSEPVQTAPDFSFTNPALTHGHGHDHGLPATNSSFDVFGSTNYPVSNNMMHSHPSTYGMTSPADYSNFNDSIGVYNAQTPTQITPYLAQCSFGGNGGMSLDNTFSGSNGGLSRQNSNFSSNHNSSSNHNNILSRQNSGFSSTNTSFSGNTANSLGNTNSCFDTNTSFEGSTVGPLQPCQSMEAMLPSIETNDEKEDLTTTFNSEFLSMQDLFPYDENHFDI